MAEPKDKKDKKKVPDDFGGGIEEVFTEDDFVEALDKVIKTPKKLLDEEKSETSE